MIGEERSVIWRVLGCSVRGASHRRAGVPNQDAIAWAQPPDAASGTILSVADGHGAAASFRSATGSTLAVQAAIRLLTEFLGEHAGSDPDQLLAAAVRELPRELGARWRIAVAEDAARNPIERNGETTAGAFDDATT